MVQKVAFKDKLKSRKFILIIIAVIIVLFVGLRIYGSVKSAAEKQAAEANRQSYVPVETMTLEKHNISASITLSGKVEADKEAAVVVTTPAKVTAIYVKAGDTVRKGQVLFSLDKTDVMTSYNQAAAVYQIAKAGYETNIKNYETAKKNYSNMQQLFELGAVSQSELDQAALLASDATLQTYKGQFAQATAAYESAQKALADMDVKAPMDGILSALDVKIGSTVSSAAPPAKVVDYSKVFVTVSITQNEINQVTRGQKVRVDVPSASLKVTGIIDSLSPAANAQGKYTLKTYIDNASGVIKPGMFANVSLAIAGKENVLAVPTDAVIFHGGKNVVYIVNGQTAVEKTVTTGLESGTETEIVSGLSEGDVIIVTGQSFIQDGSEIKVVTMDGKDVTSTEEGSQK